MHKGTALLFIAIAFLISLSPTSAAATRLEDFTWQYRVVLIDSDKDQQAILDYLERFEPEIKDRDLVWFLLSGESTTSNFTGHSIDDIRLDKQNLQCKQPVVLIGKDGGVKGCYQTFDLNQIFALIDTMPMRQREMHDAD
ncbi:MULTISPECIES: DUF4174 domain-containing protein [unclassified Vibrio]|uniref:DUF4174 domain-containing protein n=1 Tax=Vibrio sp. HB236076 TaxID=3232307 RepID=A0AB39HGF1_9VIBR|nr:DUF4174 domain-containing protein [Vibrio sp. HB161653]MDP5253290.1 DUF4174 domain-containing protein [Vibrio sp. HB161653]